MERCYVCHDHLAYLADISCGDVSGRHEELEKKKPYGWTGIFIRIDVGEALVNNAVNRGVLYAERDDNMIEYYPTNPGHSRKPFANPKCNEYRKRYGWPRPNVT